MVIYDLAKPIVVLNSLRIQNQEFQVVQLCRQFLSCCT